MSDISGNSKTTSQNKYNFQDIRSIFQRPELQIKFFHRYYYFYSDTIKKWVSDYYKFQSKIIRDDFVNNKYEEIILNMPCYTGSFVWYSKDIKNNIVFNWCSNHYGIIDLSINNMKGIFIRLKGLYNNDREIFNTIIPTKYTLEFNDEYQVVIKGLKDAKYFDLVNIMAIFSGFEETKSITKTASYVNDSYYVSIDELGTEMTYITDCIYGFSNLMIRSGLNLESDTEIINNILKSNSDSDDSDDSDIIENSNDILVMENQSLIEDFTLYPPEKYYLHDSDDNRNAVFKKYGDKSYELVKNNVNDEIPEYISSYADLKELTVMLYFINDKDKYSEFCDKYKKDGVFVSFTSIGEVAYCCKRFANNVEFIENNDNKIYDIENQTVRNIFNLAFNDSNNFIAQKVKEHYMDV